MSSFSASGQAPAQILGLLAVLFAFTACGGDTESAPIPREPAIGSAAQAFSSPTTCVAIQRGVAGSIVADTLIAADKPSSNHGGSGALSVGSVSGGVRQSLLRFDLGAIPRGSIVTSASLSMTTFLGGGADVPIHRVTAAWDEVAVTWSSFGGAYVMAPDANLPGLPAAPGAVTASVRTLAQGWISGVYPNDGLLLDRAPSGATVYRSSDDPTVALRPRLDVCYVAPTGASSGVYQWSRPWPGGLVTTDAQSNIFVSGTFGTTVDLGNGPLVNPTPGTQASYLAKLDPAGNTLWSKIAIRTTASLPVFAPESLGADAQGNIVLAGLIRGTAVDFGGGPLFLQSSDQLFVARYDALGSFISAWTGPIDCTLEAGGATVAPSGHVFFTGACQRSFDHVLGAQSPVFMGLYLVDVDPSNQASAYFAPPNGITEVDGWGESLAVDPAGAPVILIAGLAPGFAAGRLIVGPDDPNRPVPFGVPDLHEAVVTDGLGNTALAYRNNMTLFSFPPIAGSTTFTKLDPQGNAIWTFNPAGTDWDALASDPVGNTFVAYPTGGLLKLDGSGNPVWGKPFSSRAMAADTAGDLIASVNVQSPVDLGGGLVSTPGQYLVKYGP